MLRHILLRPIFFVSFIIFVTLFFVLSASAGESFNLFKAWTVTQNLKVGNDFVRMGEIDTPIIWLTLAQLKVGNNQQFGGSVAGDVLGISTKAEALINTDILQLLNTSKNPEQVFDLHQAQMEQLLDDMSSTYDDLSQLSKEYAWSSNECLIKKNEWDRKFFVGVNTSDEWVYQAGLDQSLEQAPCYITNRIQANAYAYLANRAVLYQQLLTNRTSVLSWNREILLSSYPLLQWNILEQLTVLKQQLNTVNTASFEQVSTMFQFGLPSADTKMPGFTDFWFKDYWFQPPNFVDSYSPLKD